MERNFKYKASACNALCAEGYRATVSSSSGKRHSNGFGIAWEVEKCNLVLRISSCIYEVTFCV